MMNAEKILLVGLIVSNILCWCAIAALAKAMMNMLTGMIEEQKQKLQRLEEAHDDDEES